MLTNLLHVCLMFLAISWTILLNLSKLVLLVDKIVTFLFDFIACSLNFVSPTDRSHFRKSACHRQIGASSESQPATARSGPPRIFSWFLVCFCNVLVKFQQQCNMFVWFSRTFSKCLVKFHKYLAKLYHDCRIVACSSYNFSQFLVKFDKVVATYLQPCHILCLVFFQFLAIAC